MLFIRSTASNNTPSFEGYLSVLASSVFPRQA